MSYRNKASWGEGLQRCIPIEEGKALLLDIHAGAPQTIDGKAFQQGFYRPTIVHLGTTPTSSFAIDNFTKWIEEKSITSAKGAEFFTKIIHRFGVPKCIITNNDTKFIGKEFIYFGDDNHIRVDKVVVAHPRTNAQAERANGCISISISYIFNPL